MLIVNFYIHQYTNCLFCLLKKIRMNLTSRDCFRVIAEQYYYSTNLRPLSGKKIPGQTRDHYSASHKMSWE
jgi:hypothetical protein